MKHYELKPVFVEEIIGEPEPGILHVSEKYGVSVHLCACGCGEKTVLPFRDKVEAPHYWGYHNEGGIVTFTPSIYNSGIPCKAHYFIEKNKVKWA